jgi:hypothetical protein
MTNAHGKTKGKRWGRPQRSPWLMLRKREIVELKLREKSKLVSCGLLDLQLAIRDIKIYLKVPDIY